MNVQELLALLLDASLHDNRFVGLTLALLARAATGTVEARDNSVHESFSGFWFLAPDPTVLGLFDGSDGFSGGAGSAAAFRDLQIAALLARGYPLPADFDVKRAVEEAEQFAQSQVVESSLHITTNEIAAGVTAGPSGNGLLIAGGPEFGGDDVKKSSPSSAIVGANKVTNRSVEWPTAAVAFVDGSTVTGNLVLNEGKVEEEDRTPHSLTVIMTPDQVGTAITGNVFLGQPQLPPRPGFPAPLNDWETFNTRVS